MMGLIGSQDLEATAVLFLLAAIVVGIFCASIHERVLAKVTELFNKILAFLIGAALVIWAGIFLTVTYQWTKQSDNYRDAGDLLELWSGLFVLLILGILVVGLTTTLADIRENVRRMASGKSGVQPAPPSWRNVEAMPVEVDEEMPTDP
jgi:cytosine/adenosine deaminase-related metal-dependent hydrolase